MRNIIKLSSDMPEIRTALGLENVPESEIGVTLRKLSGMGFTQVNVHVSEFHNSAKDRTVFFCEEEA